MSNESLESHFTIDLSAAWLQVSWWHWWVLFLSMIIVSFISSHHKLVMLLPLILHMERRISQSHDPSVHMHSAVLFFCIHVGHIFYLNFIFIISVIKWRMTQNSPQVKGPNYLILCAYLFFNCLHGEHWSRDQVL